MSGSFAFFAFASFGVCGYSHDASFLAGSLFFVILPSGDEESPLGDNSTWLAVNQAFFNHKG